VLKKILKFILIIQILYQSPLYSKSISFENLDSKKLSNYFSGIVAFQNNNNIEALKFFSLSKSLIDDHNPYIKRYVTSLVLERKVTQAIKVINSNKSQIDQNFFDANLLIILDSLKKNDFKNANIAINKALQNEKEDRFNVAILELLKEFIFVFKEKKLTKEKKNFGDLSLITETFQRCYLDDSRTESFFSNLVNKNDVDYSRYMYFYLSYLVSKNKIDKAQEITANTNYINSTLLLSQGKNWIENKNFEKFKSVFSCQKHTDILSEFLFLISNLYSSQDNFEKSNFYLYLSNFLNPKFIYNLTLVTENYYFNKDYNKAKEILKNFSREDIFFHWYRIKKEAQIIGKQKNKQASLRFITSEFNKIKNPNDKMIFDIANFNKNSEEYQTAIKYYSNLINNFENDSFKSDLLYRRGGSYERKGDYFNADKDLLESLKIDPDDAYVLNYLAYSWLERDYKIEEAMNMLEKAYSLKSNDPYIIDSIGWAYYLINDYVKAEDFLKRAVELMPDDPIVNDHYGDILWNLNQKIQARYFWKNVLEMDDVQKDMIDKINIKLLYGPKNSNS
tara:strand:+ start:613 stop:2301 length:1689 start_codon:yes stop_codon:yes gene_type:complete